MLPAVRRQRIIPGEDPEGVMRPFVEEWEKVAAGLQRVRWEALGTGTGCDTELLKGLPEYPGVAELKPSPTPQSPVLPMVFRKRERALLVLFFDYNRRYTQCITA
jgi:hypothetical protein